MSDPLCAEMEDRFASLLALEALGLLTESIPGEVRMHFRTCRACLRKYQELRSMSDVLREAERPGDAAGPASPESLKSLVLRIARTARSPIPAGAPAEPRGYAFPIDDCAFVECATGVRWAVVGEDGITLVYRIISPPACERTHKMQYDSTKVGVVLKGSFTISYADGTRQLVDAWNAYMVAAGVVHSENYHEHAVVFEAYTPSNLDFEERYARQVRLREQSASDGCGPTIGRRVRADIFRLGSRPD